VERLAAWEQQTPRRLLAPLVALLARLGFSPNTLTIVGLILNALTGLVLSRGMFSWGALLVLFSGAFDLLDGSLARSIGRASRFGALLDSTLDRWGEALLFLGLLFYYWEQPGAIEVPLLFTAIVGSLLVSYVRARAEGLGIDCEVGLFTRGRRLVLLAVGLFAGQVVSQVAIAITLGALALLTNVTAVQRLLYARKLLH
jgi:CDP-diacylglycerol--glycerol-3-phosphate 3-phosphatidyltransferase